MKRGDYWKYKRHDEEQAPSNEDTHYRRKNIKRRGNVGGTEMWREKQRKRLKSRKKPKHKNTERYDREW